MAEGRRSAATLPPRAEGVGTSADEILDRLKTLIAEACVIDADTITPDALLRGYGLDSIRMLDLMMTIEEELQIELRLEDLPGIRTVGELAEYVTKLFEIP